MWVRKCTAELGKYAINTPDLSVGPGSFLMCCCFDKQNMQ